MELKTFWTDNAISNYKVIYWIEEHLIKISAVFNCRQNPKKMKEIK